MGIPVTQFADACRIPRPTFSQLLSGRNKKVSDEIVKKIHEGYPDLSVMWLLFGEGRMLDPTAHGLSSPTRPNLGVEEQPRTPSTPGVRTVQAPRIDFGTPEGDVSRENPASDERESARQSYRQEFPYMTGAVSDSGSIPAPRSSAEQPSESTHVPSQSKGKRVVSIVVYYDDNSFEPFIPDPKGLLPFH